MRNWSVERLHHLHMVIQLVDSRAGIWAQVHLLPKPVLFFGHCPVTLKNFRCRLPCRSQINSRIAGPVLFVPWTCPLSSYKLHSWWPCFWPSSLDGSFFLGSNYLFRVWILVFGKCHPDLLQPWMIHPLYTCAHFLWCFCSPNPNLTWNIYVCETLHHLLF